MFISAIYFLIYITLSTGINLEISHKANNSSTSNNSAINIDTNNTTSSNSSANNMDTTPPEYLIRISSVVDNLKVPEFLSNIIPTQSSSYNISLDDILTLYGLKTISLSGFKNILYGLNISTSSVFSQNGMDHLLKDFELSFNNIYTNIVKDLDLGPSEQLQFMDQLGIDQMAFIISLGLGDSYEDFKNGDLSEESFLIALQTINISTAQLFDSCRTAILNDVLNKSTEDILNILQRYGVDEKKLTNALRTIQFDSNKVYEIKSFDNLLHSFFLEIDNQSPLGILVRYNQVITNRRITDIFKNKPIKMTVHPLDNNATYSVLIIQNSTVPDIIIIGLNKTSSPNDSKKYAIIASTKKPLENCVLFTLDTNKTIISEIPEKIQNKGSLLLFNSTEFSTKISIGSPVVCSGKVYGLVESVSQGVVTLQAFASNETDENGTIVINPVVEVPLPNASTIMLGNSLFVFVFFLLRYPIM